MEEEDLIKSSPPQQISKPHRPFLCLTRSITIFTALIFVTMFISLTIDDSTIANFMQIWSSPQNFIPLDLKTNLSLVPLSIQMSPNPKILTKTPKIIQNNNNNNNNNNNVTIIKQEKGPKWEIDWVSVELEPNYSSNLLSRWLEPGREPCKSSQTTEIKFININEKNPIILTTGIAHQIQFQALDRQGDPHCQGGDYFEIDIAGESWKSRPPLRDHGNGTYSFTLQVDPHFAGNYTLRIILLFNHFKGLSFSPTRFAIDKQLRNLPVTFSWTDDYTLPVLKTCQKSDFNRGIWAGRWTRHAKNDTCNVDEDGRYKCLDPNYPCTSPWCNGSLGLLESNGWVYSSHCSFKLYPRADAWKCLTQRWIFLWGDSNHIDTIRNVMFFVLDVPIPPITRRFDLNITNPKNDSQWVRITNVFNGHWDDKSNYLGLNSLSNKAYRTQLKDYFNGPVVPDTVIFNSGLHDGVHWPNIRRFVGGAQYAANFWKEVVEGVQQRGLSVPNFILRSTITAGGYARTLAFNPSKIEAFNGVLIEKMRETGIVTGMVDSFDMTWAWHYDNRCNDGVHYGRFPAKLKWRDGIVGHQYFVDLMLGHVLLNAICQS